MKQIARSAIIGRSAETLYALVEDIESYPEFLPWCAGARVRERTPQRTVATLSVGVKGVRHSFTTENANTPGRTIDMRLLAGPFKRFAGAWRFTPLEPLFKHIADSMVEAFARRARERSDG